MQDLMVPRYVMLRLVTLEDIAAHSQLCTPYRKTHLGTGWRVVTHMGLKTPAWRIPCNQKLQCSSVGP